MHNALDRVRNVIENGNIKRRLGGYLRNSNTDETKNSLEQAKNIFLESLLNYDEWKYTGWVYERKPIGFMYLRLYLHLEDFSIKKNDLSDLRKNINYVAQTFFSNELGLKILHELFENPIRLSKVSVYLDHDNSTKYLHVIIEIEVYNLLIEKSFSMVKNFLQKYESNCKINIEKLFEYMVRVSVWAKFDANVVRSLLGCNNTEEEVVIQDLYKYIQEVLSPYFERNKLFYS
jgi:hypothetical protein